MKILVVGDGHSAIHEVAVVNAFNKLGHDVKSFYWHKNFYSDNPLIHQWYKTQNKFLVGPIIKKINRELFELAVKFQPNMIFIYRGTHIISNTLIEIRRNVLNCKIFAYNNDDPFSDNHPFFLWRHFMKCIPVYDLIFAYRHHNLDDFTKKKANSVALLRSWFIPEINFPVSLLEEDKIKYKCDVVFIGHYENDIRLEYLEEIVKAGYNLKIFGPPYEWNRVILKSKILKHLYPINLIWNIEYSKAISGAKIALCFFSKLNRDTYTRRCFEIPATRTMLLSEYSEDMTTIFQQGTEVDLFKSKEEMIKKINLYLENDDLRLKVAIKGYQRVINNGHDILSRMKEVIKYC
jgi:spore maturation protein CgeB